jgi:hypothetical protein
LEAASEHTGAARQAKLTLCVGVLLLAGICAYALTRSPPRVVRTGPKPLGVLTGLYGEGEACQGNEVLPAGVTAIRLSLAAYFGARVRLTAYAGQHLLVEGRRGPEWTGTSITVPVKPLSHGVAHVKVCFDISPNSESIFFFGRETPSREAATVPPGGRLPGRLDIEYLTTGRRSWWSQLLAVARHVGLGRAFSGTWIALVIAALMAAVGLLAVKVTLREPGR